MAGARLLANLGTAVLLAVMAMCLPAQPAAASEPNIYIEPNEGTVGTRVVVSGNSLTPSVAGNATVSATITFAKTYFPDKTTLVKSTAIDWSGNFETDFTVEEYPAGCYKVWVYDESASPPKWTGVPFTVLPKITLSSTSGFAGENITVSGNGFAASANVTIFFDDIQLGATTTTAKGSFDKPDIPVPPSPKGSHTVRVLDGQGNQSTSVFESQQMINISPSSGPFGCRVTFNGIDFAAERLIMLTMNSMPITTSPSLILTGPAGNFTGAFYVPPYAVGTYNIKASDGTNEASSTIQISFGGQLNRIVGYAGSRVSYTGSGFIPGRVAILQFDNAPLAEATVNSEGNLKAEFIIPPSIAGAHTVLVTDGTNSTTHTFTVFSQASSSINRDTGCVGSEVTFSGKGFIPEKVLTVCYDGIPVSEATVDQSGGFSACFKIPAGVGGKHTISTTDGINTANQTFVLETIPPSAPLLLLPANASEGEQPQSFTWQEVEDPSGVTYTFQLARDAGFGSANSTNLLVNKGGLTLPEYKLSPQSIPGPAKKKVSYYWRVRATDMASNVGPWSEVRTFSIPASPTSWLQYSIVAEGVMFVLLVGTWIVRKRR